MKRVCIFCGSSFGARESYKQASKDLAYELAHRGIELVYGGGKVGLMGTLANSMIENGSKVTGIIPKHLADKEVAHTNLQDLRIVENMQQRKALMEELSDGFIVMPGGFGTLDEAFEVIVNAQLLLHYKPCGFFNISGFYDKLFDFLDVCMNEAFINEEYRNMLLINDDPAYLLNSMEKYRSPKTDKADWVSKS